MLNVLLTHGLPCSEMLVQWTTRDLGNPEVKFGTASGQLEHTVAARETVTYARDELCGPPASTVGYVDPGRMHRALLQDLQPDTRYFYQYGDKVQSDLLTANAVVVSHQQYACIGSAA